MPIPIGNQCFVAVDQRTLDAVGEQLICASLTTRSFVNGERPPEALAERCRDPLVRARGYFVHVHLLM